MFITSIKNRGYWAVCYKSTRFPPSFSLPKLNTFAPVIVMRSLFETNYL